MLQGLTFSQNYTCRACKVVLHCAYRFSISTCPSHALQKAAQLSSTRTVKTQSGPKFLNGVPRQDAAHRFSFGRQLSVQAHDATAESDQTKPRYASLSLLLGKSMQAAQMISQGAMRACSPRQEREYEAAKNSAAGSLSLRPHSRKELEDKLEEKGYSKTATARALDRLKELVCLCKYAAALFRHVSFALSILSQQRQQCLSAVQNFCLSNSLLHNFGSEHT